MALSTLQEVRAGEAGAKVMKTCAYRARHIMNDCVDWYFSSLVGW